MQAEILPSSSSAIASDELSTAVQRWCRGDSMSRWELLTPLARQCFVTAGVSMNVAGTATVMAYTAGMLPQLRRSDSEIPIDENTGSWIAATPGLSLLVGNLIIPSLMSRFGRRTSNLISIITLILGWVCIILAKSVSVIILGRFVQGLSMGASLTLGPILIAEYTSPKNRGAFLMTISVLSAAYVLIGHVIGSVFTWHTNSLISITFSIVNLPMVFFSPESPTWLADKERYEDCKKAFRWLRGDDEEEELKDIIKASIIVNKAKAEKDGDKTFVKNFKRRLSEYKVTLVKKEFYKPIFIMVHLYTLGQWAGINVLSTYTFDVFENVIGVDSNTTYHVAALDVQRIFSNILAMYIIKKIKRRTMLFSITILNILALLAIAAYTYVRSRNIFVCSILGLTLIHTHMFAVASVTLPLPLILAGEIFPLEYKGIAGGISVSSFALNFIVSVKTLPFLFKTIGLYGAYSLYAAIVSYCLFIAYLFLPETKDKTLQDIENEITGADKPLTLDELKSVQSLMAS